MFAHCMVQILPAWPISAYRTALTVKLGRGSGRGSRELLSGVVLGCHRTRVCFAQVVILVLHPAPSGSTHTYCEVSWGSVTLVSVFGLLLG